jgi:hypothetical protein
LAGTKFLELHCGVGTILFFFLCWCSPAWLILEFYLGDM